MMKYNTAEEKQNNGKNYYFILWLVTEIIACFVFVGGWRIGNSNHMQWLNLEIISLFSLYICVLHANSLKLKVYIG